MRLAGAVDLQAEQTARRLARILREVTHAPSTVMSAVAATEAYVDAAVQRLIDDAAAGETQLGRFLIERSSPGFRQAWSARHEVLREGFGIKVEPEVLLQDLNLVIDVRNALAHGDGALTSQQTANASRALQLRRNLDRRLGVAIDGRQLTITRESATTAVTILIDYIIALGTLVGATLQPSANELEAK